VKVADGVIDRVPVTAVEAMVLAGGEDEPSRDHRQLIRSSTLVAREASNVVEQLCGRRPVAPSTGATPLQLLVHAYQWSVFLVREEVPGTPVGGWRWWYDPTRRAWELTRRWGFTPSRPTSTVEMKEQLAADLTEMWCRSCLRVGERAPRHRGELCRWCGAFEAAEGFLPPVDLVEAHADGRRITDAMIVPHRQAHRARTARKGRARR
jgi:hypothetical protein